MPAYDISVHCKNCGRDHPVLIRLHIEDGPNQKQSIAELFHGRAVPPQVKAVLGLHALCPQTGKKFPLENESEIFLIPPKVFRRTHLIQ